MAIPKSYTEEDVKMKFITPAIVNAGWDLKTQIKAEYTFTDGKVMVRGNCTARGKKKRADYLLLHSANLPLAVVEAKDGSHSIGAGMQQAIEYAVALDVPFAYSSNGEGFLEHDFFNGTEQELSLEQFPTSAILWERYKRAKNISEREEAIIEEPYFFQLGDKIPRYYQRIAINRTVEAIADGQNRILLVMATGTGKTYTAFQIVYRLWKAGVKKKVLYLADRNVLIDQTISNDFKPFEKVITKVEKKTLDSSYEIYMSLYQQLSGDDDMEAFHQFQPSFFDLVIVDECHRGSARDESRWRKILDYFSQATHIGMTATPKETKDVSSTQYFGEPIYTYSLKQGIEDGFLAPYKVVRIGLDKDLEGYRPEAGKLDIYGQEIEDREYNVKDYDRNLIIDDRTKRVAKTISDYLKETDRFAKTIVFCVNINHAERMRQALVNENADLNKENPKYVMRITGDNPEGKAQLDNFIDEVSRYPTIVTTSKLMTTGVDCKTTKLIVLENDIQSMTEFKQIIGRGTRLVPDYGKLFFTIMDFRGASRLFADPNFDGEPVQIYEPKPGESPVPPEEAGDLVECVAEEPGSYGFQPDEDDTEEYHRIYRVNDVYVKLISKRVMYYDKDGKLITESLTDYTKRNILDQYATLNDFLRSWRHEERKQAILDELQERGVLLDALREEAGNPEIDDFDLICHLAYDKKPLTKAERANQVKKRGYLYRYSETAQEVLDALLERYLNDGIHDIGDTHILELPDFNKFGSPVKIVKLFGGKKAYLQAVRELQDELYMA